MNTEYKRFQVITEKDGIILEGGDVDLRSMAKQFLTEIYPTLFFECWVREVGQTKWHYFSKQSIG